ncbi:MAG: phosphatidylserine/phosphatidylglycerophosphate/cardiolipin synthase family protein [Novosphingobium sp.]
MGRDTLLIGAEAFWTAAAADLAAARHRVLVQAMTFEGDAAGEAVAAAMIASTARDRRLLVDAYSLHVTNDRMLPLAPGRPAPVRDEARATRALFDRIAAAGVALRITNPVGGNPLRFPLRNHKKLLVIDDCAYLGGINFSDHNFAWHDLMVRIEDAAVAGFLAADFARDWNGLPASTAGRFADLDVVSLDGSSNEAVLGPVLDLFAGARRSIEMIGAYPTLPFTEALAEAARHGCAVTIYTPAANNKPLLRDALFALAARSRVRLRMLPAMTHAKVALVDGERLLFGSVNFNLASYRRNGDLLAMSRDPALIAEFERALFAPARAAGVGADEAAVSAWHRRRADLALRLGDRLLARLTHGPVRVAEWPLTRAA